VIVRAYFNRAIGRWCFEADGVDAVDTPHHPGDKDALCNEDRPPSMRHAENWARAVGLHLPDGWTLDISR
jgi:hypothetical protein